MRERNKFDSGSVVDLGDLVVEGTLHEAVALDVLRKLGEGRHASVVGGKLGVLLHELAVAEPLEELDLLPDIEVNEGHVVSRKESLVAEVFLDSGPFLVLGAFDYVGVSSVEGPADSALDVTYD